MQHRQVGRDCENLVLSWDHGEVLFTISTSLETQINASRKKWGNSNEPNSCLFCMATSIFPRRIIVPRWILWRAYNPLAIEKCSLSTTSTYYEDQMAPRGQKCSSQEEFKGQETLSAISLFGWLNYKMHQKGFMLPRKPGFYIDPFKPLECMPCPFVKERKHWISLAPSLSLGKNHGGCIPVPLHQDSPWILMSFSGICSRQSWSFLQCPYISNHAIVLILGFF